MLPSSDRARLWYLSDLNPRFKSAVLICLVAMLAYLSARLGTLLVIGPGMISALWPGNVLLVSVLLIVERRRWPVLIATAMVACVVLDLQIGIPIHSIALLTLTDVVEVLVATLFLTRFFAAVPELNSVKALAKYSLFAVIIAPFAGALLGALATTGNYWTDWRIAFFSEALGFLILTPLILRSFSKIAAWKPKSPAYYLESSLLLISIFLFGYFAFSTSRGNNSPAMLYSIVPFLLWAALRFGSTGTSAAMTIVAFLSIWGAVHGRGPFINLGPIRSVLSLQLFLFCTAAPFMVLAAVVEERKSAERTLRKSEEKFSKVFSGSPLALAITRAVDDRYLDVNETFVRMTGFSRKEAIGQTPFSLGLWLNPTPREELKKSLQREGSLRSIEGPYRTKDGAIRIALTSAELIEIGNETCVLTVTADITERKQAEQTLRESEERFRLVANSAPVFISMCGTDGLCSFFNERWLNFRGRTANEESGEGWISGVHPDDREHCLRIYLGAFDARVAFQMEYRLRRFDGVYRWIVHYGVPRFESNGTFIGYIGSCLDITERRLSEEALLDMSGRLIAAHEEERARIARELHDDLSQRMALLEIGIEQLTQETPGIQLAAKELLDNIAQAANEISSDIHNLSHELHPSKLDALGLVAAVGGFCREFSKQHDLQVRFVHHDIPTCISKDLTLCLFRIVQEALRNAVKYSGTASAQVELIVQQDLIHLCISDSGAGFDPESAKGKSGLGLISMRERLRLVGGHLVVDSRPSHGTRIRVYAPLTASQGDFATKETLLAARANS